MDNKTAIMNTRKTRSQESQLMALPRSRQRWSDGQVKVYFGFFRDDPLDTPVRLM